MIKSNLEVLDSGTGSEGVRSFHEPSGARHSFAASADPRRHAPDLKERAVFLYAAGFSGREVAEQLEVPKRTVYDWLKFAGVTRPTGLARTSDPVQRFMAKVDQVSDPDGCWLWMAFCNGGGYGQFQLADQKPIGAHRFAYETFVGPIPEGLHLDHLCRVRNCVNPAHLEPVTPAENARRARLSYCYRGHELIADNRVGGEGECILCRRIRDRKRTPRRRRAG